MISLIVAASENNAIGKNNQLLWHLPNDLKYFKNITWGMVVIMGRKTFVAVNRPLPGRVNIVISTQENWKAENVWTAKNLADALNLAATTNCQEIFIIGGGEIYKQSMEMADKIYMTRVHETIDGDTFFPGIDESIWQLKESLDFMADEKHAFAYSIQTWEKR